MKYVLIGMTSICLMFVQAKNLYADNATSVELSNELRCGTDQVMLSYYNKNPAELLETEAMIKSLQAKIVEGSMKAQASYTIPVVFHIFGETQHGKAVTYDLIKNGLQKTNEDYQGLAVDWPGISAQFAGVKKAFDIEFKLPTVDPKGRPTTGVVFHPVKTGFGHDNGYENEIRQYAWDNHKYMNVYIMGDLYSDGDCCNSGVAWYPSDSMANNNTARVVYNGQYVGANTSENFRSVLTHEFGHWLNLPHTFEGGCSTENESQCTTTGDFVCDTPQVDNSGIKTATQLNCMGQVTNWENFMSYATYSMFTNDQVTRSMAALELASRRPLWQSANLNATGVNASTGQGVMFSNVRLAEGFNNDGVVEGLTLTPTVNARFALSSGNMTEGLHYNLSGLPAGLNASISVQSDTRATLSVDGSANAHAKANNTTATLTFLNAAISGGTTQISNVTNELDVSFLDPYTSYGHRYPNVEYCCYSRITNVTFGSINHTTDVGISYNDYTATQKTTVNRGSSYNLAIKLGHGDNAGTDTIRTRAWFDWNGNYVFEDSELVTSKTVNASEIGTTGYVHNASVTIPNNAVNSHPIAMRVLVHYVESGATGGDNAYNGFESGEAEDYGIIVSGGGSSSGGSSSGGSSSGGSSSGGSSSGGSSSGGSSSGGSSSGGSSSGGSSGGLSNGQTVTGLAATQGNRTSDYYIDVPAGASDLTISISGGTGDADLYVKKGSAPTDSSYDCRPYDSGNSETCGTGGDTLATSEGRFYINLKAYSAFTGVSLTASYTGGGSSSGGSSSGGSSSGGSSSGGSSSGGSSSGGSSGGLSNGQTVTGLAATQGNRTSDYYIDVPAGASDLTISISGGTGDADLYVKKGSAPTDSSYDCRPYDSGNSETCGTGGDTLATSEGRFYINIKAYSAFTGVSLTASYTGGGSSSGGSSSGGSSSGGSSSGGSSSGGSSSGGSSGGLSNGQTVSTLSATAGNALDYYIDVPASASNLTIAIAEGSGHSGDADLYVKKGSQPTDSDYDCRPYIGGSNETCGGSGNSLPTSEGRFHIRVKAYSNFNGVDLTASFTQ